MRISRTPRRAQNASAAASALPAACIWCLNLVPIFGAYIWCLYLEPIFGAYIWCLYLEPISGAFVVGLESVMRMRVYFGAYIWSLYKFGAYIWCLYLVPLFGAYIWSLYLEPIFGASCVGARGAFFLGFAVRHQLKAPKWCLYLVPSWLGALLSGAFLKTRCSVAAIAIKKVTE
jgi:hypothetical protein